MPCCGQRRAEISASLPDGPETVAIRYRESAPILVRGSVTGRHYQFSGVQSVQPVDRRDAAAFLRTPYFQRSG